MFRERFGGEDGAAVEDEGGLEHEIVDAGEVECAELVPLGEGGEGVGTGRGLVRIGGDLDVEVDNVLGTPTSRRSRWMVSLGTRGS